MAKLDINAFIASIRAQPGRNFDALAYQRIQDYVNQLPVGSSSTPTPTPTPSSTGGGVPAASVVSPSFKLYVSGVLSAKNSGNLNSSNPAPPDGFVNVGFREDNTLPIPGITAYSPNVGYVNNQVGTTYTVLTSDFGKLLIFTNAGAVTVTIDVSTLPSNFFCGIASFGAGGLTITPTSGTIDGSASLALANLQGLPVYSDGTDLWTERGLSSGSSINFAPPEVPTDSGDHQNFTLTQTPNPSTNLTLYLNGMWQLQGAGDDYTLSGNTITLANALSGSFNLVTGPYQY